MSTRTDDEPEQVPTRFATVGVDAVDLDRYGHVRVNESEVIIYDLDNEDAWLQSASTIGLDAMV